MFFSFFVDNLSLNFHSTMDMYDFFLHIPNFCFSIQLMNVSVSYLFL